MAKWIAGATPKATKGALRRAMGAEPGKPIPAAALAQEKARLGAKKKLTPSQRRKLRQINLAQTLKKLRK